MTDKELRDLINKHSTKIERIYDQKAYAIGNNTSILRPYPKEAPDNRKTIPFARRAVSMIKGYMAKPGNIKYSGKYYDNTLKAIYDYNDEQLTTANELEDALIHGVCYELHWLENGVKNFFPIPVEQSIPIYDNSLRKKLIGFVWYRTLDDDSEVATYYDSSTYEEYKKENGEWKGQGVQIHGYNAVPVNIGQIDRDYKNLFDHVLPLIDLYDKLISEDVANEAERFNAALLLMAERMDTISTDENGLTMVDKLKSLKLLDGLGEGDVKQKVAFTARDIPTGFIELALKTVERLVYEMLMIVNPNDDNFATASGVAQAYKLLGMEYLCSGIEAHFSRFLQNRIYLIGGISKTLKEDTEGIYEIDITFDRNLPHNILELAEIVSTLKGIISDETLLKLFPSNIIPDVVKELEAINAMKESDFEEDAEEEGNEEEIEDSENV